MCALPASPPPPPLARLAEALETAASELSGASSASGGLPLTLPGTPVRGGRVAVGRLRRHLPPPGEPVAVVVGFGVAAWLGAPSQDPPGLGKLLHRSEATVDQRGRVLLGRHARAWLGVADPALFDAVTMPAAGGVLVVPADGFAERFATVTA